MYESIPWTSVLMWAVLLGLIPAFIASSKGHSFFLWWLFGALLFIAALPGALMLQDKQPPAPKGKKVCPYCAEWIQEAALVCRHCGRDLQEAVSSIAEEPQPRTSNASRGSLKWIGPVFAIAALGIVLANVNWSAGEPESRNSLGSQTGHLVDGQSRCVYARSSSNLRSGPGRQYSVVATAAVGERLPYEQRMAGWYRVRSTQYEGPCWIHESVVFTEREMENQRQEEEASGGQGS